MMKKYICTVCAYVYDPEEHNNVEFKDLDEEYLCPICAVYKDKFEEI